jgi:hypothetical protein
MRTPVAEYDALQNYNGLTLLSRLHDVRPVLDVFPDGSTKRTNRMEANLQV